MGQIDKKLKNQLFKVAVDHIYKEHLVESQGELAEKIGISPSALSRIMNDKKFVGDDTLRKMNEAFGGIFNMAYFRGDNVHFLVEDAIAAKAEAIGMKVIPQEERENSLHIPDYSSLINSAIASMDVAITAKDEVISSKEREIESLHHELETKDVLITELRHQISQLQLQLAQYQTKDSLKNFPFPPGFAESESKTY